jgi:Fe-S cluster biogenesis protein NfuA
MDAPARLFDRVRAALDELRPALQMDGGDAELVGVEGEVVRVRLLGACCGCPMAEETLVGFVEARLRQRVPEVRRVVRV